MSNEPSIQDVLEAVQGLSSQIDERFAQVDERFAQVDERFSGINTQFKEVRQDIFRLDNKIDRVKDALEAKIDQTKNDLTTEIDRFVNLHQTMDVELISMRSRCDRMEGFMHKVAKHLDLEYLPNA